MQGKAYIFNQIDFDHGLGLKGRDGAEKDASLLEETLKNFGFSVTCFCNLKVQQIRAYVKECKYSFHFPIS
jgi:Caspase domain